MTAIASGSAKLTQILTTLNQAGGFSVSVLTDAQGLALASAADAGQEVERQSAVVAYVQKAALQAARQLDLGPADEIVLATAQGQRLVCRPFDVGEQQLILAMLIPQRGATYRRASAQAVKAIRTTWMELWS